MANAYSLLNNFDEKIFSPDINLINTVLQTKQSKLDNNRLKIEQALSEVENLDLIRDVDKQYAANRLNKVNSIVDKYANMDLSSSNLTRSLTADISQVMDDKVKSALISTKIYRGEQEKWAEFSQKNPTKYSQANHAYAMRGADSWLNSQELGQSYNGGGGIIEYTDYQKTLNETLPEFFEELGIQKIQNPNGSEKFRLPNGNEVSAYTALTTVKSLPKDYVRSVIGSRLSSKDYQQMQIDSWDRYGRGENINQVRSVYTDYLDNDIKSLNTKISDIKSNLKRNLTEDKEKYYNSVLGNYNAQLNILNSKKKNVTSLGFDNMSFEMYQDDFLSKMEQVYAVEPTVIDIELKENKMQVAAFEQALKTTSNSIGNKSKSSTSNNNNNNNISDNVNNNILEAPGMDKLTVIPDEGIIEGSSEDSKNRVEIFDDRFKEKYNSLNKSGMLGELNAENLAVINSYDGGETFAGKKIKEIEGLTLEQTKAQLLELKDITEKKLYEVNTIKKDAFGNEEEKIEGSADIFYKALVESDDYDYEGALDYDFHIEVSSEGIENLVLGNGQSDSFSFSKLYKKQKDNEPLSVSEQKTIDLKNKLSFIIGGYKSKNYSKEQANTLLNELSSIDDLELFIPKDISEIDEADFGNNNVNPSTLAGPSSLARGNVKAPPIFLTQNQKEIYNAKILPYLEAIGEKSFKNASEYTTLVRKMEAEGLETIPENYKEQFIKNARKSRFLAPRGDATEDFYYSSVGVGDLEYLAPEDVFFDTRTLIVDGEETDFNGFLKKRMTKVNQDLKKEIEPTTFKNKKDIYSIDEAELNTLDIVLRKADVFDQGLPRNIKPVKGSNIKFMPQKDGSYAIVGAFEYKKDGNTEKNAPTIGVSFGETEKEKGSKFFTISKGDFEKYVAGSRIEDKKWSPYDIDIMKDNAKPFRLNKSFYIEDDPTKIIASNLPVDIINNSNQLFINKQSELGIKTRGLLENELAYIAKTSKIEISYLPVSTFDNQGNEIMLYSKRAIVNGKVLNVYGKNEQGDIIQIPYDIPLINNNNEPVKNLTPDIRVSLNKQYRQDYQEILAQIALNKIVLEKPTEN